MKFDVFGEADQPVIVMLPGSFCQGASMDYLYTRLSGYHIVVVTYNGHHEASKDFTTRQDEATEICTYLKDQGITDIALIYGQSMGAEVGMELYRQLTTQGAKVRHLLWDGAPMIRLSRPYKAFMRFKFSKMLGICRTRSVDDVLNMGMVKKIVGSNAESLRPMVGACCQTAPFLTEGSIRNVTDCCYTFDYPTLNENMQHHTYFLYGDNEKAYKTCYKYVIKAYPKANYRIIPGQGHCTYSCSHTDAYLLWMRELLAK